MNRKGRSAKPVYIFTTFTIIAFGYQTCNVQHVQQQQPQITKKYLFLSLYLCVCTCVCVSVCGVRAAYGHGHGHASEAHSVQHPINCCVCYYLHRSTATVRSFAPAPPPGAPPAPPSLPANSSPRFLRAMQNMNNMNSRHVCATTFCVYYCW